MKLLVFICLIGIALGGNAQILSDTSSVEMRFRIFYPVNQTTIHEDYMDNANSLYRIQKYLEKSPQIDSITIYSYASPEGPYALNKRLARERGKTAKQYLLSLMPAERQLPDSLIILDPTAENWSGLRDLVRYQYQRDDKDEVLAILDRTDITDERRKLLLKRLNRGKSWQYILKELMPQLRYATWISVWQRIEVDRIEPVAPRLAMEKPDVEKIYIRPVPLPPPVKEEKTKSTVFALKSNLLYDALTALNLEVEIPIGDRLSVAVEDVFPWWNNGNKWAFQMWEMGVEGRYWFKRNDDRDVLTGWFGGLYGMSAKYDFQWKRDICYQGEYWSAGLSGGYAFPISKYFNLELSASFGYLSTAYRHYVPTQDYGELIRDPYKQGRKGYFGPTKLKVSLVIPIRFTYKKNGGAL